MGKLVIGFSGCARVGKTTAAGLLYDDLISDGIRAEQLSFAGPLKDGLATMGVTKERYPKIYRNLAQHIGTNVLRAEDSEWWANVMAARIDESDSDVFIIDDVRFPNEINLIQTYGGVNVFVIGGDRIDLAKPVYDHESEEMGVKQELAARPSLEDHAATILTPSGADLFVNNSTTYDDFVRRMKKIQETIRQKIGVSA